jgi:hypothetical protein
MPPRDLRDARDPRESRAPRATRPTVVDAIAKTMFSIGVFLLVAAGWGYIAGAQDPVHDTSGQQLVLVILGAVLAVGGRLLRTR